MKKQLEKTGKIGQKNRLSSKDIKNIIKLFANGEEPKVICRKFNVHRTAIIYQLKKEGAWVSWKKMLEREGDEAKRKKLQKKKVMKKEVRKILKSPRFPVKFNKIQPKMFIDYLEAEEQRVKMKNDSIYRDYIKKNTKRRDNKKGVDNN